MGAWFACAASLTLALCATAFPLERIPSGGSPPGAWDGPAVMRRLDNATDAFEPGVCALRRAPPGHAPRRLQVAVVAVYCMRPYKEDHNTHLAWMDRLSCHPDTQFHLFAKCHRDHADFHEHVPAAIRDCSRVYKTVDSRFKSDMEVTSVLAEVAAAAPDAPAPYTHLLFVKDTTHFDLRDVLTDLRRDPGVDYLHVGAQNAGLVTDRSNSAELLASKCAVYQYFTCQRVCQPWVMGHHTTFLVSVDRVRTLQPEHYAIFYRWMQQPHHYHWPTEQAWILVFGCLLRDSLRIQEERLKGDPVRVACAGNELTMDDDTRLAPSFAPGVMPSLKMRSVAGRACDRCPTVNTEVLEPREADGFAFLP